MEIILKISGMHCGACASSIEMALTNHEGVSRAKVDFFSKKAVVEFDEKKTNVDKLIKAIDEFGYKASK